MGNTPPPPYDGMARADPTARLARQERAERLLEEAMLDCDAALERTAGATACLVELCRGRILEARRLVARL